jgi:integrase
MAKGSDHLAQHRNRWYFKLSIPRPMQHLFLSDTGRQMSKIVESLGDVSHAVAKLKAAQRATECAVVFDQVRAGAITTPDQAKRALLRGPVVDAEGNPFPPSALAAQLRAAEQRFADERQSVWFEAYGRAYGHHDGRVDEVAPTSAGETINQALEAWVAEMTRDEDAAPRQQTVDGHRIRVRAFIDKVGDIALTAVTRAVASDFLAGLEVSNRTRNNYAMSLKCVFDCARRRGRFTGENPLADQRSKVVKKHKERYTIEELKKLFAALPREVDPKKHTPETAMPWAALIATYSGACLEEIRQLTVDDVREEGVNGGRLWCIDIHNGDDGHQIKNDKARPRLLPMHSALVRAGLLKYIGNLPDKHGQLFPGLKRRASKDNKIGPRVGELFNKKLRALGIKREGLDFHSFRHTVGNVLDEAGVPQPDAARVLGHAVAGMSYGTYSHAGPGLIRVKEVVEKIKYKGLRA